MKKRLVVVLLLIVLLPLGLLGWLGTRVVRDEQESLQRRFEDLLEDRLRDVDGAVTELIAGLERDLLELMDTTSAEPESIRSVVRRQAFVRQMFVLDASGKLIHPMPGRAITEAEREFLVRTRRIWLDRTLVHPPAREGAVADSGVLREADSGWYVWYWGNGINLIFWRKTASGQIVGAEVDRMRLMSDIVGKLPAFDPASPAPADGAIALADSKGNIIYQWGGYEPGGEAPRAVLALSYPLNAWELFYYVSPAAERPYGGSVFLTFVVALSAAAVALGGLAAYFYRESSREMREAVQRVNFVNQVSHELKTPLTNIRMYAELLQKSIPDGEEKLSRNADVVVSESQRLSRLINNVLTFGRKRRKGLTLRMTSGVVDDVIRDVMKQFGPSLESKGVNMQFSNSAGAPVQLDVDAVGQILGNLFSNVEKYACSGGLLKIESRQEGDETIVDICDMGPGIPQRESERIFEPFHRVSEKLTDGAAGTGIGLTIARDLARLHRGDLTVVPSDKGACFRLTLKT